MALQGRLRGSESEQEALRARTSTGAAPAAPLAAARRRLNHTEAQLQAALTARRALEVALEQRAQVRTYLQLRQPLPALFLSIEWHTQQPECLPYDH